MAQWTIKGPLPFDDGKLETLNKTMVKLRKTGNRAPDDAMEH